MLSIYPACFIKGPDGYTAVLPDWDNAVTCGNDFEDTMSMAIDLLAGLIFDKNLKQQALPAATQFSDIDTTAIADYVECNVKDIITTAVSVNAEEYAKKHFKKCVKKTVTILEWQNEEGIRRGINFSKIFQDALTKELLKP